jgi:hypothetical protein
MDLEIKSYPFPNYSTQFISEDKAEIIRNEILQAARSQNKSFLNGSLGRINSLHGTEEQSQLLAQCPETVNVINEICDVLPAKLIEAYGECIEFPDVASHKLFTRVDISIAKDGYSRPAHLDREYHLAINFLYLSGSEQYGGEGGELKLMAPISKNGPTNGDKFPDEKLLVDGSIIAPKAGLLAGFLRTNESWHTVNPMKGNHSERVFIFFGLDSPTDIWTDSFVESTERRDSFLAS